MDVKIYTAEGCGLGEDVADLRFELESWEYKAARRNGTSPYAPVTRNRLPVENQIKRRFFFFLSASPWETKQETTGKREARARFSRSLSMRVDKKETIFLSIYVCAWVEDFFDAISLCFSHGARSLKHCMQSLCI